LQRTLPAGFIAPCLILKQAYAMEPGTQKEIIIDHGDGLCSKVMIERSTDELNAFIDPDAAKNLAVPLQAGAASPSAVSRD
jgi:hypothetical protein